MQKVNISKINYIISKLNEVNNSASKGLFKNFCLNENDFPKTMTIYIKNMIEVPIDGLSGRAINFLKRLGSVINSKYYENQRRRLSVYNEPKYIILYEDNNPLYLKLPIGTLDSLKTTFNKAKVNFEVKNLREEGDKINVTFKGKLKPEQELAFGEIINFDNGIINAPTGFGKTVLAIYLISYFKVNTLILVNKQTLLKQWLEKLEEFLDVGYEHKKVKFGSYYSAKKKITNKIDVASILSFSNDEESKKILSSYGLVIIDEVHHLAANKYNLVAKEINAKRIYGFTATPIRSDGNMDVVFKLVGDVRYIANNADSGLIKKMTPIYTNFVYDQVISNLNYNDTIDKLIHDESRNELIVNNIIKAINETKNILILSERIEHLEIIFDLLKEISYPKYFITGQMKLKERKEVLEKLSKE